MTSRQRSLLFFGLLVAAIAWCVQLACSDVQPAWKRFCGLPPAFDHVNQVTALTQRQPYIPETGTVTVQGFPLLRRDVCYPALALAWIDALPRGDRGFWISSAVGAVFYAFGFVVFLRRFDVPCTLPLAVLVCSFPFLRSVYIGNLILHAAGALAVFFAWYDAKDARKRYVAACCLGLAAVLKVTPVLAGLLYLRRFEKPDCRSICVSAGTAIALLVVPFAFYGGAEGFQAWLQNAAENAKAYVDYNEFGFYGFASAFSRMIGYRAEVMPFAEPIARFLSVSVGLFCLAACWWKERDVLCRILLVCMAIFLLPPTMMYYVALYVVPVLFAALWHRESRLVRACAWYLVFTCAGLHVPLMLGSLNDCFKAAAMLDLTFVLFALAWKGSRNGDLA